MFIIITSLLLTALYLTSPSKRKTPKAPNEFSFTDYKNRVNESNNSLTNLRLYRRIKSSGTSSVKKPTQAKILPFKRPASKK